MYILEHDDVKLVDLAEGLMKALCTGFCEIWRISSRETFLGD